MNTTFLILLLFSNTALPRVSSFIGRITFSRASHLAKYTYENYEITTYPDGEKERIYSNYFLNEEITTTEGVKVSDDFNKMKSTYGQQYENQGNQYTYKKGKTNLEFIVENDVITSIQYTYTAE